MTNADAEKQATARATFALLTRDGAAQFILESALVPTDFVCVASALFHQSPILLFICVKSHCAHFIYNTGRKTNQMNFTECGHHG